MSSLLANFFGLAELRLGSLAKTKILGKIKKVHFLKLFDQSCFVLISFVFVLFFFYL